MMDQKIDFISGHGLGTFFVSYFGFSFNLFIFVLNVEEEQTIKIK